MNVAIIPARGGSKGIPGKNLKCVGGVPLIVRAVRAAKQVSLIDQVVVSTDDEAIKDVAQNEGAVIVHRPFDLSGDDTTSEEALLHALSWLSEATVMTFMQCTSPFTRPEDVEAAIRLREDESTDVVFSAVATHAGIWRHGASGTYSLENYCASRARPPRQRASPWYIETGGFYIIGVEKFKRRKTRFFDRTIPYVVDARTAWEIDTPWDLAVAKAIAFEGVRRKYEPAVPNGGWIGVDFDGCLAYLYPYDDNHPENGRPLPEMVARVKAWLAQGRDVRIFTCTAHPEKVQPFCREHFGRELPVTDKKDKGMEQIWDDRAVSVERNTGRCLTG